MRVSSTTITTSSTSSGGDSAPGMKTSNMPICSKSASTAIAMAIFFRFFVTAAGETFARAVLASAVTSARFMGREAILVHVTIP